MNWLSKLLLAPVEKEEGDFRSYLERLENGDFKDKLNYGVAEDRRGFLLVDPVQQPGALYCGGMGSGKSIAMRYTVITNLLANSENTFFILVDPLKGMTDYAILFNDKFKKNVAVAINDTAKLIPVIEMVHQECMARKEEFSKKGVEAPNIYEFEKIMRKKDPNYPGLARIIICIEEFHAVPNAEIIKYHMNVDRPGSAAYMLKELLRVGRSYGITLMAATQRATSDDFPSSLKPGITQLMAFRVNNPGDATAINLPLAADIRMEQRGRCVYEGGFIQFPYLDDQTSSQLLNKYYKPLKAKFLRHTPEKYHEAFSGEGNQGLVKVKPLKGLLDNYQQFKLEDIVTRFLESFDFKVSPQPNSALTVNLVAERDDIKYAVAIVAGRGSSTEKSISTFKEGAKLLGCNQIIAISIDSSLPSGLSSAVSQMGGFGLDNEDLNQIARVLDSKEKLESEGRFEVLYKKLPLIRKEVSPATSSMEKEETDGDDDEDLMSAFTSASSGKKEASVPKKEKEEKDDDNDLMAAFDSASAKPKADEKVSSSTSTPSAIPARPLASTGGGSSLMDLRERLKASLQNKK